MTAQAPLTAPSQVFSKQQCEDVAHGAVALPGRELWEQQGGTAHVYSSQEMMTCAPFLPAPRPMDVQAPFPQIQVLRWVLNVSLEGSFTREEITRWFKITFLKSTIPSVAACPINTPGV